MSKERYYRFRVKKYRINKPRFIAFLLATGLLVGGGITLTHNLLARNEKTVDTAVAENNVESQNEFVPYTYYYTTGDMTFVSNGDIIGYLDNAYIDFSNVELQHYEVDFKEMYIGNDNATVYKLPDDSTQSSYVLKKGDKVTLNAYSFGSNDVGSWSVIQYHDENFNLHIGFIKSSYLSKTDPLAPVITPEPEKRVKVATITGDRVHIRSSMETNTNNHIDYCYIGDKFVVVEKIGNWYLIDFYGQQGYVNGKYVSEEEVNQSELDSILPSNEIEVAKITGNNVNVRSSMSSRNDSNIIGFCDISDKFEIVDRIGDWYQIKYLGKTGYVHSKYVRELTMDKRDFRIQKMVYLPKSTVFYNSNGRVLCNLPAYQNVFVLEEKGDLYKVSVDGVIGYVKQSQTKELTDTCMVVDLSRQIVKVFKKGQEVFRAHVITGAENMQTRRGCFTVGHHLPGFTFKEKNIYNEYWVQFDNNRGFHPADANNGKGWQKQEYFDAVAKVAYQNWAKGKGKLYPHKRGSHGCVNMRLVDVSVLYSLCDVDDNVLVIEQNDLIKNNLLGKTSSFAMVSDEDNLYLIANSTNAIITVPNEFDVGSGGYDNNAVDYDLPKIKTLV